MTHQPLYCTRCKSYQGDPRHFVWEGDAWRCALEEKKPVEQPTEPVAKRGRRPASKKSK